MYKLLCLIALVALANAKLYTECTGKELSAIQAVEVQGCSATPCILQRGSKVELKIEFQSKTNTNSLTTKVYGVIGGIKMPWTGLPSNACPLISPGCPLANGKSYEYKGQISVLPAYPAIKNIPVQFEFKSDDNSDVICFRIPVSLQ